MPGNVYGHGEANLHFEMRHEDIVRHLGAEHQLLNLEIDGQRTRGLLKEIQYDALGERVVHVDLQRISLDEVIETSVVVHLMGNAKGVAAGGVLDLPRHELPVRGKPTDLPERIEIEVTGLGIGDMVRAGDLQLPDGVEMLLQPEEPVVMVQGHQIPETGLSEEEAGEVTEGESEEKSE